MLNLEKIALDIALNILSQGVVSGKCDKTGKTVFGSSSDSGEDYCSESKGVHKGTIWAPNNSEVLEGAADKSS